MFNTTASTQYSTAVPDGVPSTRAVELLQDHAFLIRCDPHLVKFEPIDPPAGPAPAIPKERRVTAVAAARQYRVTDRISALPAGLWDSDLVSTYEFTDIERGVFVRIRSPMNTTLETVWEVREAEDGGVVMVEDVVIKSSRFLIGIVKSTCEDGRKGIHEKLLKRLLQQDGE